MDEHIEEWSHWLIGCAQKRLDERLRAPMWEAVQGYGNNHTRQRLPESPGGNSFGSAQAFQHESELIPDGAEVITHANLSQRQQRRQIDAFHADVITVGEVILYKYTDESAGCDKEYAALGSVLNIIPEDADTTKPDTVFTVDWLCPSDRLVADGKVIKAVGADNKVVTTNITRATFLATKLCLCASGKLCNGCDAHCNHGT